MSLHYVLSTHWDREWHQGFQDFRYRLIQLLDEIISGLQEGRLKGPFQTDGQAIILEDYLEIRPERRVLVEQLVRERKLVVGPWYVMPDEFLVSGEALIRNLRLGRQLVRDYGGEPSSAGFLCDLFGHNSQMPQILASFGMPGIFLWRGINQPERAQYRWRAADGTELPAYRFGRYGYCSYAIEVRGAEAAPAVDGDPLAQTAPQAHDFDADKVRAKLKSYVASEQARCEVDSVLIFDGGDHQEWDQAAYRVLLEEMDSLGIAHTDLDQFLVEFAPRASEITAVLVGELREPGLIEMSEDQQWVIPGVLSSRVWIKQQNTRCQNLLCHWAEPLSAMAHYALQREYPLGFLNVAWRWLLQNHPHDSICGCSVDRVHQDVAYRFRQARQIAERQTTEAARSLALAVQGELSSREHRVVVFNPLPRPVHEVVELGLQVPAEWPCFNEFFGYEAKPAFRIYTADGTELPYQRLAQVMRRTKVQIHATHMPHGYATNDVAVAVELELPAMGYTTLTLRTDGTGKPTRHPEVPALAISERALANEYLMVEVQSNGTLVVEDRFSGARYRDLLTFEDCADIGDGWYHGIAVNDQVFASTAAPAEVALVHNGPLTATLRIRTTMTVPASFELSTMMRSDERCEMIIDSLVTLRRGSRRIEVKTTVDNPACDHRLRVLLPSGAQTDTFLSDSAFDVVERPITLRLDNHLYREPELETKPQWSWSAVHDDHCGLGVVAPGQLEVAVRDQPQRPLALTLFRSTRRTVFTDGEPEGQLLGRLDFAYWIVPLQGRPDEVEMFDAGQLLGCGLLVENVRSAHLAQDRMEHPETPGLAPSGSLLQVRTPAIITSTQLFQGGLEVRLFNPLETPAEAVLELGSLAPKFTRASLVDFEGGKGEGKVTIKDNTVRFPLRPKQIQTVHLES